MKETITKLINSEITAYRISKDTGVSVNNIQAMKNGKRKVGNLTLDTAEILYNYALKLKKDNKI